MEMSNESEAVNAYIQSGLRHAMSTREESFGFFDTNIERHLRAIYEDRDGDILDCFMDFFSNLSRLVSTYAHIKHTHKNAFGCIDLDEKEEMCGCQRMVLAQSLKLCENALSLLNEEEARQHTLEWVEPDELFQEQFDEMHARTLQCAQRRLMQQQQQPIEQQQQSQSPQRSQLSQQHQQPQLQRHDREEKKEEKENEIDSIGARQRGDQLDNQLRARDEQPINHVVWGNPPSLRFTGNVSVDLFERFWKNLCGDVFGRNIPRKFDLGNIEQVEKGDDDPHSILVAFSRRPKKFHLLRFVESVRDLNMDFSVSICDTFDSPSKTNCTLSSFLSPRRYYNNNSVDTYSRRVGLHSGYDRRQQEQQSMRRRAPSHEHHNESSFFQQKRRSTFSPPNFDSPHRRGYTQYSPVAYAMDDTQFRRRNVEGSGRERKLMDLERKLDQVMSFLMSRFGFG